MRYVATIGERQVTVDVEEDGRIRQVSVDGVQGNVEWHAVGTTARQPGAASHYSLMVGTQSHDVYVSRGTPAAAGEAPTFDVSVAGVTFTVRLEDERLHALAGMAGTTHEHGEVTITAPMPGLVSQVVVGLGQLVERGQTVIILEAMKMENDLGAPRSGVVQQLNVARGDTVNQGQVLAVVGDPPSDVPTLVAK
jgi:biotin carboxyl carrier protein